MLKRVARTCVARRAGHAPMRAFHLCGAVSLVACVSRPARTPSHAGAALAPALSVARRAQSTSTDKKFHCSICQKGFRLEMAAKVHLQQAHGGAGTVEAGPGANVDDAPPPPFAAQPARAVPVRREDLVEEKPRTRRSRPTPKPLYDPEKSIPPKAMSSLMAVWDDIGVKRLGDQFVHSSMIVKVFAAKSQGEPLYDVITPVGKSPFSARETAHYQYVFSNRSTDTASDSAGDVGRYSFVLASPNVFCGGFAPAAAVMNPFLSREPKTEEHTASHDGSGGSSSSTGASSETGAGGSALSFGKLPLFSESDHRAARKAADDSTLAAPPNPDPSASSAAADTTPFASAIPSPLSGFVDSPFAQAVVGTPFSAPAATVGAVTADAPDASAIPPSPFVSAEGMQASPFTASPFAADFVPAAGYAAAATTTDAQQFPVPLPGPEAPPAAPAIPCETCGRTFTTHEGMRMHAKAKHGVEVPRLSAADAAAAPRDVPDLPVYIPSPVDLSMTAPFCTDDGEAAGWCDTELMLHAASASNTTLVGTVAETIVGAEAKGLAAVLKLRVPDPVESAPDGREDVLTVRCVDSFPGLAELREGDRVIVSGTFRPNTVTKSETDGAAARRAPVLVVTAPCGLLQRVN